MVSTVNTTNKHMITITKLSLKNFLSIGNVVQELDFDNKDLTLILGENLDLGGNDAGSRNGVGKTSVLQGLSYALFGSAINSIKRDNLINRTNEKNMVVTIEFSVRGTDYKIVRGRRPNVLKFYINNTEQATADDDSQGDSRQTQEAIERVLCMSSTMFQHIIGLNSYTTPFLSMKVGEQREVIEQLLGITLLSEKAEAIKELNKRTKEEIQSEEYRIRGVEEANRRIQEQIDSLKRRQTLWTKKHDEDLGKLAAEYQNLIKIDIDTELENHRLQTIYNEQVKKKEIFDNLRSKQLVWKQRHDREYNELVALLEEKNKIDIESELNGHRARAEWNQKSLAVAELTKLLSAGEIAGRKELKQVTKLEAEIEQLKNHRCYACGQDFHDSNHESVLETKEQALAEALAQSIAINNQLTENTIKLQELSELGAAPVTYYKTEAEAIKHGSEIDNILSKISAKEQEVDPYKEQLLELTEIVLGIKPVTHYGTETEAIEHRSRVTNLEQQITSKTQESDPYAEQLDEMAKTGIQSVDYTNIDRLNKILKHQDYLLDLLTNKKSFVRKKIIEQNLSYLNARLTHYLDKIGLPHRVVFQNDLSVEITELGRDLDFDNLSRGERNRLILSLSFAFRDVFENLFSPINLMFIDELMDSGMDTAGVENGLAVLKDLVRKRRKSVWLVSHKDELMNRVESVLHVVKENGYTSFKLEEETE
jgi:DNA repair exonuclease SbcCD ATPase subunit